MVQGKYCKNHGVHCIPIYAVAPDMPLLKMFEVNLRDGIRL